MSLHHLLLLRLLRFLFRHSGVTSFRATMIGQTGARS